MGLHETAAGRWKVKFRFRLSLFRPSALNRSELSEIRSNFSQNNYFPPIECSEDLNDTVLATELTMRRKLDSKRCLRVVISVECESFPTGTIGAAVLEFRGKLLDSYEVLIRIFVLKRV